MSYTGTPTVYGRRQIAAAYATGTRLPVVAVAVGDGGGSAVTPVDTMTALVRETWRGPITSWGVDPADPTRILVRTTVPANAGAFTIREAGVYDDAGGMVAVTALAATEIVAPGTSNQLTALDLIIALPINSAGAITVNLGQGERVLIERLTRTPFISINSASTTAPPANPALGDLYIVPANPGGAWATAPLGTVTEWNGIFWAFIAPPIKMVAGIMDQPEDGPGEYLKWNGTVWEPFAAQGVIFEVNDDGTSTADHFVGPASPGLTALQPGMIFRFRQGVQANQGASPKANIVNSAGTALGDRPFGKADGSMLPAGDLPAKAGFFAEWDGALLRVFGQRPSDQVAAIVSNGPTIINAAAAAIAGSQTFPSSGQAPGGYTFTVPAGVTLLKIIEGWGGGGGGGGAGANSAGAGGVGGTYGVRYNVPVTPGQVIPITVGAGGTAGLSGTGYGGTGGATSIGSIMSCPGGGGGQGSAGGAGGAGGTGGGPATGASFTLSGDVGGGGYNAGGTYLGGVGGGARNGGSNTCGNGNGGATTANFPGGGGGGAGLTGSGGVNGAVGACGLVKITW